MRDINFEVPIPNALNLCFFSCLWQYKICFLFLQRRLEKQRALLENKMKEEQAEQAEVRRQEDKIVG